jgi:WD40 repeat protein
VSDGEKRFLKGHGSWVLDVDFDPERRSLASASWDRSARIWNLEGGEAKVLPAFPDNTPLDLVHVVQFDGTGQILALGGFPNYLGLWDVINGVWLANQLTVHTGDVESLSFSSDGRILATGSEDETIILWDVKSRRPLGLPFIGHDGAVNSVAFSPDNTTLWSSSGNGVIMSWDVGIDSWRPRACSIANRNLTPAEWKEFLEPEPYQKTCPAFP